MPSRTQAILPISIIFSRLGCFTICYLQGGIAIPSSPVTSSIDLAKWVLMTSFGAYEGEPVGEGPADYSP
jgi:hypothetical protein